MHEFPLFYALRHDSKFPYSICVLMRVIHLDLLLVASVTIREMYCLMRMDFLFIMRLLSFYSSK